MKNINERLSMMAQENVTEMQNEVIFDLLQSDDEETKCYIRDILEYGCQSGIVPMMIYYQDTKRFFRDHFEEILEMAEEVEFVSYSYNELAWFGYEETVRGILVELGEEI